MDTQSIIIRTSSTSTYRLPLKVQEIKEASEYEFQISQDKDFKEIRQYISQSPSSFILKPLEVGIWYYRVKISNDISESDWSKVTTFEVVGP
jgi:hypothetical protein